MDKAIETFSNVESKYVTKIIAYEYDYKYDLDKLYPLTIFYDDGMYKGYISHTEDTCR